MLAIVFPVYCVKGDWTGRSGVLGTPWYPGNVVESFGSCVYKNNEHTWDSKESTEWLHRASLGLWMSHWQSPVMTHESRHPRMDFGIHRANVVRGRPCMQQTAPADVAVAKRRPR